MKFTPGPWYATENGFVHSKAVKAVVTSCGDPTKGEITNGIGCMVADQRGERDGNARLIAAAPDMFAALKELLEAHRTYPDVCYTLQGRQDRIDAAEQRAELVIAQAFVCGPTDLQGGR